MPLVMTLQGMKSLTTQSHGKNNISNRQWSTYNPGFIKTQWNQWRPSAWQGKNYFGTAKGLRNKQAEAIITQW